MGAIDSLEHDDHQVALAHAIRQLYALPDDATVELINHSENLTYRIDEPAGQKTVLRLHRVGYQSHENILADIAWMNALIKDADIQTPQAMPGSDGELIQTVKLPGITDRRCVRFQWIEGQTPEETGQLDLLLKPFEQLGAITARLHQHARHWRRPDDFVRQSWDEEATLGANPIWGRFIDGPGLSNIDKQLLNRCADAVRQRLERFGKGQDRFGLIHADMRLANIMVHQGSIRVIDFDDCGPGWFLYDLGTALSFMEDRPDVPELVNAWVAGYRTVRPLSAQEERALPTFIMLRRLTLLGWSASRGQTGGLAEELGEPFSKVTCALASQYLDGSS
jgi:Ser/Thr protein kinase RdoA (MazF antagonist)